jgi:hypothetical protein
MEKKNDKRNTHSYIINCLKVNNVPLKKSREKGKTKCNNYENVKINLENNTRKNVIYDKNVNILDNEEKVNTSLIIHEGNVLCDSILDEVTVYSLKEECKNFKDITITYTPFYNIESFFPGFYPGMGIYLDKDKFIELYYILKLIEEKRPKINQVKQHYELTCKWEPKVDSELETFYFNNKKLKNVIRLCQHNIHRHVEKIERNIFNNFELDCSDSPIVILC